MLSSKEKGLVERTEDWVYIDRLLSNEDKARIETLLSNEEFLALLEVKYSTSKGLNQAVNFSAGSIIQQEVPKSGSEQEVNQILEVGERKLEDESFGKPMLPEKQESGQEKYFKKILLVFQAAYKLYA